MITSNARAVGLQATRIACGTDWDWTEMDWDLEMALESGGPDLERGGLPATASSGSRPSTAAGDEPRPPREAEAGIGTSTRSIPPPQSSRLNQSPLMPRKYTPRVPLDIPHPLDLCLPAQAMLHRYRRTLAQGSVLSFQQLPTSVGFGGEDRYDPLLAADIRTSVDGDSHPALVPLR